MQALRAIIVPMSVVISVLLPIFMMAAALGTKFGLWSWETSLLFLIGQVGPILLGIALLLGVVALLLALFVKPQSRVLAALIALTIPVGVGGYAGSIVVSIADLPPIHDISTDWDDPPIFSDRVMVLRGDGSNPIQDGGAIPVIPGSPPPGPDAATVSELQKEAYPDIRTIQLQAEPADALLAAKNVLQAMGFAVYPIVANDLVEATSESFWFGFKDDIVVRVRPAKGGGTLMDVRSVSRVGVSDLGANADRIRTFREQLLRLVL